ncbi:MAG TPA: hypothetical protein VIU15_20300 [Streptomyces sp.]
MNDEVEESCWDGALEPMSPVPKIAGHRQCAEVRRACMLMSAGRKRGASVEVTTTRSVARARIGSGLAVTVLLLPFGGYGLARAGVVPEGVPIVLSLLSVIASSVLIPALCEERAPVRHLSSHLTAHTLTGERSVDLNRITTVRLLTTFSYGSTHRTLLVRDAHGVRLGITTERSRRELRRAIEKADANAAQGVPRPRVSRAARAHMGLASGRRLVGHTVFAFLLLTVSVSLYVSAVLRLGGQ